MISVALCGCNGKMGHVLTSCINNQEDMQVVVGFDINTEPFADFPIFSTPAECDIKADILIDFSHPSSLSGILTYAKKISIPVILATTGYSKEDEELIKSASQVIPVFFSANMSLGISLLAALAKKAASILGEGYDVEIVEKHHNLKVDAPSGTALMLGNAISEGLPYNPVFVYDRHSVRKKREKTEIGFSSIRGGTIVGEHDILFCGHDETITLSHTAQSKELLANGAISAARFMVGKPAGYYTMNELIEQ